MAEDFLPHLFSPFRQEEEASTRQQGGLGLGLSITRSLVEAHGGLIRAHSAGPGQGATFHVTLPRAAAAPAPLRPVRRPDGRAGALLGGVHLLLVEDDALSRAALCRVLRRHGARVQAVDSVRAALGALERRRPHVLVSDLALPGEDGLSLVRQVRARAELGGCALPALALSARARAQDRARALEAGFDAHLGKPAEPDALVALLRQLLAQRAAQPG
jgi:CheY-like chemotaxis protein